MYNIIDTTDISSCELIKILLNNPQKGNPQIVIQEQGNKI